MDWWALVLVGAFVFFWWLGRPPSSTTPPVVPPVAAGFRETRIPDQLGRRGAVGMGAGGLGAEVLRRATDPDDPDGAFMDGYVAGRLTERSEIRDDLAAPVGRDGHAEFVDASYNWSGADEEAAEGLYDAAHDDMSDDDW